MRFFSQCCLLFVWKNIMKLVIVFVVTLWAKSDLVSGGGLKETPCPDLFRYESTDQPKQWSGTVTLLSDSELYGVWVRVLFDEKLTQLQLEDNRFVANVSEDGKQVLIKNRDFLLKQGTPTKVKITVKYEGNKVPSLIGYRLNAKIICPEGGVNPSGLFAGDIEDKDFISTILSSKKPIKGVQSCGTSPLIKSVNEDVKNEKSQEGQWPWHASIAIKTDKDTHYACAGSLISPKHILTAGHCVTYKTSELSINPRKLSVTLGKLTNSIDEPTSSVKHIMLYPGFDSISLLNDLAILELDESVTINDHVRPVCLGNTELNSDGILIGFGLNRDKKLSDLHQAKVHIVPDQECQKKLSDLPAVDNTFCASYIRQNNVKSNCVGDSGSGLVTLSGGSSKPVWELKGVVTLGPSLQNKYDCDPNSLIVLADIARYRKWIQAAIS